MTSQSALRIPAQPCKMTRLQEHTKTLSQLLFHTTIYHKVLLDASAIAMAYEAFLPPINRAMKVLDRSFFQKDIPISAASVLLPKDISRCRAAFVKSRELLNPPTVSINPVCPDPRPDLKAAGRKCLLLKPEVKHDGQQLRPHL
jgi:hypothetical protein